MRVKSHLLFISLLFVLQFNAQTAQKNDSLDLLLLKAPDDSAKVNQLIKQAYTFDMGSSNSRISNFMSALSISKKIKYVNGCKKIYVPLVTVLYYKNMFDLSLTYCKEYIDFCEKNKLNDEKYAIFNMMGNLLCRQGKYAEAKKYYNSKRSYDLQSEDFKSYAGDLNNMSLLFSFDQQYDSALAYSLWAGEIYKRNNMSYEMANTLLDVSGIYLKKDNFESAEEKANEANAFYLVNNDKGGMARSLFALGAIYASTNKPDSAFKTFSQALLFADSLNLVNVQRDCYKGLADMYLKTKNYRDAYEYNVLAQRYQDSVSAQLQNGKILELEMQYSLIKQQNEAKDKEFEVLAKSNARTFLFISIAGFILLCAVAYNSLVKKRM